MTTELRLRAIFFACLGIQILIILPIILTGLLYIDDLRRAAEGFRQYSDTGKPIADALFFLVNLGDPAVDVFPLNQILAACFIAAGCTLLASLFQLDRPILAALGTLPLGGQPYFLQNYSYAFDSVIMAAGLACAIAAGFLTLQYRGIRSALFSIILVSCSLLLYQYTVIAYGLLIIVILAFRLPSATDSMSILVRGLLASVGAVLIYELVTEIPHDAYGAAQSTLLSFTELKDGVVQNYSGFLRLLKEHWSSSVISIFALSVIGFALTITIRTASSGSLGRSKLFRRLLVTSLLSAALLLATGISLFVKNPTFHPRYLVGIGVILSLLNLIILSQESIFTAKRSAASFQKWFYRAPILLLAYGLVLHAFSYGRATAAQRDLEISLLTRILHDVSASKITTNLNGSLILGIEPMSPTLENTSRKFPSMLSLVPRYFDNDFTYGHTLLEHHGFALRRLPIPKAQELCLLVYGQQLQPFVVRDEYELLVHDGVLIIRFRLPQGVQQQCDRGYSGVG